MKNKKLEFITNLLVGPCLGIIVDFFAGTTYIFTIVGILVGIILAFVLQKNRKEN